MRDNPLYHELRSQMAAATPLELVADLARFIDSFGDHDPDCPGFDARGREAELEHCVCGFVRRWDFIDQLERRLA